MSEGPIDWEHPPSQRRRQAPPTRRLVYDCAVLGATGVILYLLLGALLGSEGLSQRGIRHFMLDAVPGARTLAWGVVLAVAGASLYAGIDLLRALRALRNLARSSQSGD